MTWLSNRNSITSFSLFSFFLTNSCRLKDPIPRYTAIIAPMVITLVYNAAVFIAVWRVLYKQTNVEEKLRTIKPTSRPRPHLWKTVGLTAMLGLSWAVGLALLENGSTVIQTMFAILVVTQGFAIFLFQVALNPQKKDLLLILLSRKKLSISTRIAILRMRSRPIINASSVSSKLDSPHFAAWAKLGHLVIGERKTVIEKYFYRLMLYWQNHSRFCFHYQFKSYQK